MTQTKWLTVAEASLLCAEMGLERTSKTIRGWARKEHVIGQKKSTSTGEMWVLDRESLETKIKTEIEYRDQTAKVQTGANPSEPVQTRTDQSGQVRTSPNPFEVKEGYNDSQSTTNESPNLSAQARIRELESQSQSLRIDVAWRDKMLEKVTAENEKGQDSLHAQARYIGHLESDLLRLGGKPDQTFLAAPKPQDHKIEYSASSDPQPEIVHPQRPHPDQTNLYTG